ncbi:MAG: DUF2807 domain-containing protein [Spirochaetales bacterium]|uniref:DUF2807 domain-containing protein n=1 Tax=Candidatus Thalassospirochaeta sargassi TaxID=3119039 RepID=A0AAJ1MLC1_9SPIO|nr:DUF2807 domain-containing protein [Spirochaetales bacterium]
MAVLSAAVIFTGCNMMRGSGIIVENEVDIDGFKSIDANYNCDLTVTQGDEYSVTVNCDDNIVDSLDLKLVGDSLYISLAPYSVYNYVTFEVIVVMPSLEEAVISGATDFEISGFESDSTFNADVSGASRGTFSFISVGDISAEVSGASEVTIEAVDMEGTLYVKCSGASKADLRDIEAKNADVELSGASKMWVDCSGTLSGSVSGASDLYYQGGCYTGDLDLDISSDLMQF